VHGSKAGVKVGSELAEEVKHSSIVPPEIPEVQEPPETPYLKSMHRYASEPAVEEEKVDEKQKKKKNARRKKSAPPTPTPAEEPQTPKTGKKRKQRNKQVSDNELANFRKRKDHERPEDKREKKCTNE
jgi:hypothetical protein